METVRNITVEQARDMINGIDASPIPECRDFDTYTETDDIRRIGDHGYVDVYEQAFRDHEERNGKTEWASTMHVPEGNQPTRLEFLVKAYDPGGMPMPDGLLDARFDNGDADNVHLTNGEAWPIRLNTYPSVLIGVIPPIHSVLTRPTRGAGTCLCVSLIA